MTEWWVWKDSDKVLHMTYVTRGTALFIPTKMYCGARVQSLDRHFLTVDNKKLATNLVARGLDEFTPCYDCLTARAALR